jgi:hypothetical protein
MNARATNDNADALGPVLAAMRSFVLDSMADDEGDVCTHVEALANVLGELIGAGLSRDQWDGMLLDLATIIRRRAEEMTEGKATQ